MTQEQETRDRILDAARDEFVRNGTSGARMQEIADQAGVNKALLHYYFGSKERLAEGVFVRAAQRLIPPVIHVLLSDATLESKVRRVVELYQTILPQAPELPAYVLSEMNFHPERMQKLMLSMASADDTGFPDRLFHVLGRQIDEGVAAGTLRPIAPQQLMVNIVSLCVFPFAARPMVTLLLGGSPDAFEPFAQARADTLADFILGALRP